MVLFAQSKRMKSKKESRIRILLIFISSYIALQAVNRPSGFYVLKV